MFRVSKPSFAVAVAILLPAAAAEAQNRTTGGASSFGASSGSAFGSSSSLGSSRFGSGGFGTSSFGSSSLGQSSLGQSSFGSGSTFGANTTGQANQAFVGRGSADMEAFFGNANQFFESARRANQGGQNRSGASSSYRPEVRVTLTAAPELRRSVATEARASFQTATANVARLLSARGLAGVSMNARADGVVTLEGVVASRSERLVAEKLAAIEPGVTRVENHLRVATAEELPAGQ